MDNETLYLFSKIQKLFEHTNNLFSLNEKNLKSINKDIETILIKLLDLDKRVTRIEEKIMTDELDYPDQDNSL